MSGFDACNLWVYGFGACNFLFDSLIFQSGEKKKEKKNATRKPNVKRKEKKKKRENPSPETQWKGMEKRNATKPRKKHEKERKEEEKKGKEKEEDNYVGESKRFDDGSLNVCVFTKMSS